MTDLTTAGGPADALQRLGQSASAQLVWTAGKVLLATFISGSIALGVGYIRDMRDDVKTALARTTEQDKAQSLMEQRVSLLQRVSDSTVLTLQQIGTEVTQNKFAIQSVQETQRIEDGRHGRSER